MKSSRVKSPAVNLGLAKLQHEMQSQQPEVREGIHPPAQPFHSSRGADSAHEGATRSTSDLQNPAAAVREALPAMTARPSARDLSTGLLQRDLPLGFAITLHKVS